MRLIRLLLYPKQFVSQIIVILFVIFCFANLLQAQSATDIVIDTKVSGDVIVSSGKVTFTVNIQNTSGSDLSNVFLHPQMPEGMVYVASSAIGMTESSAISPYKLSFQLANLPAGGIVSVSFGAVASCAIINYIKTRTGNLPSVVNNITTLTYIKGGAPYTIIEPNGSDSYNVLYPVFDVMFNPNFPNDDDMSPVQYKDKQNRHIMVQNTGTVAVNELTLSLKNDDEVFHDALTLTNSLGVTTLATLSPFSYDAVTHTYLFKITNFDGKGKTTFAPGDIIYFTEQAHVEGINSAAQTDFSAPWGTGSIVCNMNDQNAIISAYIESPTGSPSIKDFYFSNLQPFNFNNSTPAIGDGTIENIGSGSANAIFDAMYDIKIDVLIPKVIGIQYVKTYIVNSKGDKILLLNPVIRNDYGSEIGYEYDLNQFLLSAPDPDGTEFGLSNIQGNFYNDLAVGQKFKISFEYSFPTPLLLDGCISKYIPAIVSVFLRYKNWCGQDLSKTESVSTNLFSFNEAKCSFSGPTDLGLDETGIFSYLLSGGFRSSMFNELNSKTIYTLTLPEGYELISAADRGNIFAISKQGNSYQITSSYTTLYDVSLDLKIKNNCAGLLTDKSIFNIEGVYYFDKSFPSSSLKFGCNSVSVVNHCGIINGIQTTGFNAKRTTLGWKIPSDYNFRYTYDEMYGSGKLKNKVEFNNTLRLNAAYPKDMIQMIITGAANGDAYHGLHAQITYDSPFAINTLSGDFFDLQNGDFILTDPNGTITHYKIKNGVKPVISLTGKTFSLDFDLGNNSFMETVVSTISSGSTFQLIANFQNKVNNGPDRSEFLLDNFRGQFNGIDSKEVGISNLGYGTNFYTIKPERDLINYYSSLYGCDKELGFLFPFYELAANVYSNTDFPNEYRPISILSQFSFTLPTGFKFNPDNRTVKFCYYSLETILNSGNNITFSPDNKRIDFNIDANTKIGNLTYQTAGFYTVKASVLTDEFYVPSNQGFTVFDLKPSMIIKDYAYLDDPAQLLDVAFNQTNTMFVSTNPQLQLTSNNIQEGYSKKVTWPVNLCNLSSGADNYINKPTNSWVAVELGPNDNRIKLEAPTADVDLTGKYTFYHDTKDLNNPNGRAILIQLGDINGQTCKSININATYDCSGSIAEKLDVYASWSCSNPLTVTPQTVTVKPAINPEIAILHDNLEVRYKTADMQWALNKPMAQSVSLCEPMPFELTLTTTQQANVNSLKLTAELPPAVSVVQEQGLNQPYYTFNGITKLLPLTLAGNKLTVDVSSLLPDGELLGNYNQAQNEIKIGLSVMPNGGTDFDAGLPVKFNLEGKTNCNVSLPFDTKQQKIKLNGLDLDDIAITVNATGYTGCSSPDNTNVVTIQLTNQLNTYSVSDKLVISFPENILFGSFLSGSLGVPISSTTVDGITVLTFNLPAQFLGPLQTKIITFSTFLQPTSPSSDFIDINVRTTMQGQVNSLCEGQTQTLSSVGGTTGSGDGSIDLNGIFPFVEIDGYNLRNHICTNTMMRLKANITGTIPSDQCTYLWLPTNQTTQNVGFRATAAMDLSVLVTAPNGCQVKQIAYLTVSDRINPLNDVDLKTIFDCTIPSGKLSVINTLGNQYEWYKDGQVISGEIKPELTITESGTYVVYVTKNACTTASDEIPVNLNSSDENLNIVLDQTFIETGYNLTAKVNPWRFGTVYSWNWGDDTKKSTLFAQTRHSYSNSGLYTISVTSNSRFGCSTSSNNTIVDVKKSLCASTIPNNLNASFYLDKNSGRIVYLDPICGNEIDFSCISGQATQVSLRRAVNASAVTYSDQWIFSDDDLTQFGGIPANANIYDIGKAGKWRPNANFTYNSNLSVSSKNYDAGTFTLEPFNYQFEDCNNTSRWVRLNSSEYYNPNGSPLQNRDAIGIPSSEKYGYNKSLVYISAQNAESADIFFESFENVYSNNGNDYFEDNMAYDHNLFRTDDKIFHSGKKSLLFNKGTDVLFTRPFYFSQQVIQNGLLISYWVHINDPEAESQITNNMVVRLVTEGAEELTLGSVHIVAHVGDWFLVEGEFTGLSGNANIKEGFKYIPAIYFTSDKTLNIDDIRIQPTNSKITTYVFDSESLRLLTIFDEQLFGLFHQYDQEGKLIRKQVETEKGKKTVQETFYNIPKSAMPTD